VFFFCRWGINAERLGGHDAGVALSLAFAASALAYLSVALAAADVTLLLFRKGGRPQVAVALLLSLVPLGFLALRR
jgi:hypothetical protein